MLWPWLLTYEPWLGVWLRAWPNGCVWFILTFMVLLLFSLLSLFEFLNSILCFFSPLFDCDLKLINFLLITFMPPWLKLASELIRDSSWLL